MSRCILFRLFQNWVLDQLFIWIFSFLWRHLFDIWLRYLLSQRLKRLFNRIFKILLKRRLIPLNCCIMIIANRSDHTAIRSACRTRRILDRSKRTFSTFRLMITRPSFILFLLIWTRLNIERVMNTSNNNFLHFNLLPFLLYLRRCICSEWLRHNFNLSQVSLPCCFILMQNIVVSWCSLKMFHRVYYWHWFLMYDQLISYISRNIRYLRVIFRGEFTISYFLLYFGCFGLDVIWFESEFLFLGLFDWLWAG